MSIMIHISKNKRTGRFDLITYRNGHKLRGWRGSWRTDIQAHLEAEMLVDEIHALYGSDEEVEIAFKPELGVK